MQRVKSLLTMASKRTTLTQEQEMELKEMKDEFVNEAEDDFACEVINLDSALSKFSDQKGPVKSHFKKITNYSTISQIFSRSKIEGDHILAK